VTAAAPDVDQLQHLDFAPTCQAPACRHGHPAATHLVLNFCTCPPWPVCAGCVADLQAFLAGCDVIRCRACRSLALVATIRYEPLP